MIRLKETDLLHCCGSTAWAKQMAAHAFPNVKEVFATGDSIWWSLEPRDWKEAFAVNAKISKHGSEHALEELRDLNRQYEERFGYSFVHFATGKSAHSIIEALRTRMQHEADAELRIAAEEQRQITHGRLKRILGAYK